MPTGNEVLPVAEPQTLEEVGGEFVSLEYKKRALEAELKMVEAKQGQAKTVILKKFQEAGISSITAQGMTVYLHRQTWAGLEEGKDKAAGCAALRAAGLGDLVTDGYNSQSVSSRLREFEDDDTGEVAFPPELAGVWKLNPTFDIRARKA